MKEYCKTYESGLRLVFQKLSKNRPASLMIAVDAGSKDESDSQSGISHFVEHLNFKGTDKLSAKDIMVVLENNGIDVNAVTSKLYTQFFGTTLPEKIETAFDILSQIVFESNYKQADINKERKVVFREIEMHEDSPESVLYERFCKDFYAGTPYESSVLGSKKTLMKINNKEIVSYVKTHYVANKIVVSVSGCFRKSYVKKLIKKYISNRFKDKSEVEKKQEGNIIIPKKVFSFIKKDVKQTQIILGFPTPNIFDKNVKANFIYSLIFGGAASSRLFQKVREEKALVYSINCSNDRNIFGGVNTISFGTTENNAKIALALIKKEIDKFVAKGVTDEELEMAKILSKSLIVSANEEGATVTRRNATNMLSFNKILTMDSTIREIESLTKENVNEVLKDGFDYSHMVGTVVTKNIDKTLFDIFK
ncbi:MAG: insulinase family protein [Clostridia bacterium]|nr:insulinase family protein [Clostridia bacterium]